MNWIAVYSWEEEENKFVLLSTQILVSSKNHLVYRFKIS